MEIAQATVATLTPSRGTKTNYSLYHQHPNFCRMYDTASHEHIAYSIQFGHDYTLEWNNYCSEHMAEKDPCTIQKWIMHIIKEVSLPLPLAKSTQTEPFRPPPHTSMCCRLNSIGNFLPLLWSKLNLLDTELVGFLFYVVSAQTMPLTPSLWTMDWRRSTQEITAGLHNYTFAVRECSAVLKTLCVACKYS